jgi:dimethylargininase
MLVALTRQVSRRISECELTHLEREPIDLTKARNQHYFYERCLEDRGCRIHQLPEEEDLPDSVFVEDTAIVLNELAVITNPGANSRKAETLSIAKAIVPFRELSYILEPATIDGGDVLVLNKNVYVGLTNRTNREGASQLRDILKPYGYKVDTVEVKNCLHLKSAVTQIATDTILINKQWVNPKSFIGMTKIEVDPAEPQGANALLLNGSLIYPSSFQKTRHRLKDAGFNVVTTDVSEFAKAEGAITCCSLVFEADDTEE